MNRLSLHDQRLLFTELSLFRSARPVILELLRDGAWIFMDEVIASGDELLSLCAELDCDSTSSEVLPDSDGQDLTD